MYLEDVVLSNLAPTTYPTYFNLKVELVDAQDRLRPIVDKETLEEVVLEVNQSLALQPLTLSLWPNYRGVEPSFYRCILTYRDTAVDPFYIQIRSNDTVVSTPAFYSLIWPFVIEGGLCFESLDQILFESGDGIG